jgi:NDP-sugar pyrophosphorylase family protein
MRVIIMAGGAGRRLLPYTSVLPKPLMPVGERPILDIVLRQLKRHGFHRITISVGHLAELIMSFFGNGSRWGLEIDYAIEDEPLGTMGPLSQIEGLTEPFIVMNGDLLTDVNYRDLYDFHTKGTAALTVATYEKAVDVSLGVLEVDQSSRVVGFREKPTLMFTVSMGIYVLSPELLQVIPKGKHFGFDDLMYALLAAKAPIQCYRHGGLWLDIGRREDYDNATEVFEANRNRLLPEK